MSIDEVPSDYSQQPTDFAEAIVAGGELHAEPNSLLYIGIIGLFEGVQSAIDERRARRTIKENLFPNMGRIERIRRYLTLLNTDVVEIHTTRDEGPIHGPKLPEVKVEWHDWKLFGKDLWQSVRGKSKPVDQA